MNRHISKLEGVPYAEELSARVAHIGEDSRAATREREELALTSKCTRLWHRLILSAIFDRSVV